MTDRAWMSTSKKFQPRDVVVHYKEIDDETPALWVVQKISRGRKCLFYYTIYPVGGGQFSSISNERQRYFVNVKKRPDLVSRFAEFLI